MERYDYRTNDLLGAARYAAIYSDGFDGGADEPSPSELAEDEYERESSPVDPEARAVVAEVLDEVYGRAAAVADLPF